MGVCGGVWVGGWVGVRSLFVCVLASSLILIHRSMQAALVAYPSALDVVRAVMAQHPGTDVITQGHEVLDAVQALPVHATSVHFLFANIPSPFSSTRLLFSFLVSDA